MLSGRERIELERKMSMLTINVLLNSLVFCYATYVIGLPFLPVPGPVPFVLRIDRGIPRLLT